ncbi:uncharacterized protein LKV04_015542 [Tautogolabrus adspersus]
MKGVMDPESKSPVNLEQAIQKGLIRSEEAYQVLEKQVAEGGIIHHVSGMRLSVADAVDRGLVDRSIAPGLEELEWVYQGKVSPSSHPKAVICQAMTGAILDPDTGGKLTLTKAVSKGLLDEDIASEAMASANVAQGVLDPQTARIVPYLELVNQGRIDIETGQRFLEVKPFRGVQDEQKSDNLTLLEAVASKQVDPVPALRLLQSQADSGGIIDISSGERLPLLEACERGLVGDSMVRVIATNQFLEGGLVDPATGQKVPSPDDAVAKGLISSETASEIQEKLPTLEIECDEGSTTPVTLVSDTYSPAITLSLSSPDSPANWSDITTEVQSTSPVSKKDSELRQNDEKTLTSALSDQLLYFDPTIIEDKVDPFVFVEGQASVEPDHSIDLLSKFATDVEKRIQEAIHEITPDTEINKSKPLHKQELDARQQTVVSQSEDKPKVRVVRDSVDESIQTQICDTGRKDSQEEVSKEATFLISDRKSMKVGKKERPSDGSIPVARFGSEDGNLTNVEAAQIRNDQESKESLELSKLSEEKCRKSDVEAQKDDVVDEKGQHVEKEEPLMTELKSRTDLEQSEESLISSSKETESKRRKKRKNKKNGKGKEVESETHYPEIKEPFQIDQSDAPIEGKSEASVTVTDELASHIQTHGQAAYTEPVNGQSEANIDLKMKAIKASVKQRQETVQSSQEFTKNTIKKEKDAMTMALSKDEDELEKRVEFKREEEKEKIEEASVSQQPDQPWTSEKVQKSKGQELPRKSNLPDNEKAALILKAKESILKKVFEEGVSGKQAAVELQALHKGAGKKESQGTSGVKVQTLPAKVDGLKGHDGKDECVKRPSGSPKDTGNEMIAKEDKTKLTWVKEDLTAEKPSVKEDTKTKLLETSTNEREKKIRFGEGDKQKRQ